MLGRCVPGRFIRRIMALLGGRNPTPPTTGLHLPHRAPVDHVVLLDGTLGKLGGVDQTSIGRIYELLREATPRGSIRYGQGLQWNEWNQFSQSVLGWGIEQQIRRSYGWLATRYRPGDRIFLLGYSRGAFAVRSLAGIIDRVGLLRPDAATERNVHLAWRYYEANELRPGAEAFRRRFCHPSVEVEMVGVFDTVMALGFRFPLAWVVSKPRTRFHDAALGRIVRYGYQALALNETRSVFEPLLWDTKDTDALGVEQVWFRGCHGDIGGQLGHQEDSRPLANIPLVWMLERMEQCGLVLPEDWRNRFPCDPQAPSVGSWRGWSKVFLLRAPRVVGRDPSESIHESAVGARMGWRALILPGIWRRRPASGGGAAHDEAGGRAGGV